jgi:hypothetical protein
MNRRHRLLALPFAALLILGLAGQTLAAPGPSYSATITANRSCLLTVTAGWKNTKAVAAVYVGWYEVGYINHDYPELGEFIATSAWPGSGPNSGVQKGSSVAFTFGPTGTDTVNHSWYALVSYYDANGAALTQFLTSQLSTRCYLPSF